MTKKNIKQKNAEELLGKKVTGDKPSVEPKKEGIVEERKVNPIKIDKEKYNKPGTLQKIARNGVDPVYLNDIKSRLDQYEQACGIGVKIPINDVKRAQTMLWAIVKSIITQNEFSRAKTGLDELETRFRNNKPYNPIYLFRHLAIPSGGSLLDSYALKFYDMLLVSSKEGRKNIRRSVDVETTIKSMPKVAKDNIISWIN